MASVGRPPGIGRGGAGAWTTASEQARQPWRGLRIAFTRSGAGTMSSIPETSSAMTCIAPPQHGQPLSSMSTGTSKRGRRVGSEPRPRPGRVTFFRPSGLVGRGGGLGGLRLGHHRLEPFQRQLELIGAELLGAPSEPVPLQLSDQEPQPLDLGVTTLDPGTRRVQLGTLALELGGETAQRHPQEGRIVGQPVEIERHDACCRRTRQASSTSPARTSLRSDRGRLLWPLDQHRAPPVEPLDQHRQLRRRQRDPADRRLGPDEAAALQPLGKQPRAAPPDPLQPITPATAGQKQLAAERIAPPHLVHLCCRPVEPLAHVDRCQGQADPGAARQAQPAGRRPPSTPITLRRTEGAMRSCTRSRQPFGKAISIVPAGSISGPSPTAAGPGRGASSTATGTKPASAAGPRPSRLRHV